MAPISGHATAAGTERFRQRCTAHVASGHFRQRYGLWMSSMGLGTMTGAPTDEISQAYARIIPEALAGGCNVIDTAPIYRLGRAEGDVGAALTQAIQQGIVSRDEVLICTKAGYLPGMWPQASPAASMPAVSMPAVSMPDDVVADVHSMDPAFLARQIASSAQRMGLETIDVVYIQNPDIRLFFENVGTFMQRVQAAFEGLEQQVAQGTIRFYGMAVDEGFLADPSAQNHLPLYKLVQVAEAIAGPNHHFRFVQFPYHMGMSTGLITSNQPVRTKDGDVVRRTDMPMLAAALQYGITAVTCAGLYQGTLADELPEGGGKAWARRMGKIDRQRPSPAQASLHFNRSTPGLTTTLFSTTDPAHLAENLAIAPLEPWAADPFISFMGG